MDEGKKVFMVIDDDEDDRFFFKEALTEMFGSVECFEANGTKAALELLRRAELLPHFIFLDINMHSLDGRECLKELKRESKLRTIPVIMYSTSFTDKSIAEFHALGASSCINKPSDMNNLPAQILEAIR